MEKEKGEGGRGKGKGPESYQPTLPTGFFPHQFLYSFLLSWFTTRNEKKTTAAPIQYMALEYWCCKIIWATRDKGIVRLRPTVTTSGEVRNIAYAQQMSEAREVAELI